MGKKELNTKTQRRKEKIAEHTKPHYLDKSLFSLCLCALVFNFLTTPISLAGETWVPLTLEHAATPEQREWGLMGRTELAIDHGMLFSYSQPKILSFWMFNCFMDLSLAFLDASGRIQEIHPLKAHPEKMDPSRPVKTPQDLALYPSNDPVVLFFRSQRSTSSQKTQFALEMRENWFRDKGVKVGDQLIWSKNTPFAYFIKQ